MEHIAQAFNDHVSAKDENFVVYENADTTGIIEVILLADGQAAQYTQTVSPLFMGEDLEETCENVFDFIKDNIRYQKDPSGHEQVKSPGRLWEMKEGDCKSMAIFIASILKNLGVPYVYRFAHYPNGIEWDQDVNHVFVVADPWGKGIIIDPVTNYFNYEEPYSYAEDWDPEIKGPVRTINGPTINWKGVISKIIIFLGAVYLVSRLHDER